MRVHLRQSGSVRVILAVTAMALLTGCYERVISERPFAGMASGRRVATASDYSEAQAEFEKKYREQTEPKFDPFGDFGRWVGGLFSSGEKKPASDNKDGSQATTSTPSGTTTAPITPPASSSNSNSSPFNTAP